MANSFVRYVGNGSTDAYAVPFSYRAQGDVAVTVDGVAVTAYTWNGAGTVITFTTAPLNLTNIEIRRTTSQTTRLVDYEDGSVLTENTLDTDSNQAFFMGQEAVDDAADKVTLDLTTFQWKAGSKRITNVADPTAAQDAATKNYLETTWLSAADKAALTSIAGVTDEIGRLGTVAAVADLAILGTSAIVTDMDLLATSGNVTAMGLLGVSGVITDMGLLGTSAVVTDLDLLATSANVTAMGLLGNSATVTDLGILGTSAIVTDLDLLATSANVTAMGLLGTSANVTAMGLLGNSTTIADMAILATTDIVADLAQLATTDFVADLNQLATTDFVADLTAIEAVKADVTTVADNLAGVTSFAERYRVGSSNPASSLDEGDLFFNTSDNALKYYNGTSWASITAGIGSMADDTTPQLGGDLDLNGNNIDFPTTANISDCLDEDTMSSNSATKLATQQSIKAYADTKATTADVTSLAIALG